MMDEMEGVICRTITIKTRNIKRIVVNMPWKEKRDFFERMARYVLRILYNTKENRQGNRNIYRGVVKKPTIRMEMRKAAGMSQEQLAEILCTKKATISAYENDHIDIKSSIVLEIAKALNCSGSYLLEGKKAEALDARIMDALLELKNDQMREE